MKRFHRKTDAGGRKTGSSASDAVHGSRTEEDMGYGGRLYLRLLASPLKWTVVFSAVTAAVPALLLVAVSPLFYPFFFLVCAPPLVLTVYNAALLFCRRPAYLCRRAKRKVESVTLVYGGFCSTLLSASLSTWQNWDRQLYNAELHAPMDPDKIWVVILVSVLSLLAFFVIRFLPAAKQPPLVTALCLAFLYLGVGIQILWCVQIFPQVKNTLLYWYLFLLPLNSVLILSQIVLDVIRGRKAQTRRFTRLSSFLNRSASVPLLGAVLAVPLLGLLTLILVLFGQEPDYLIQIWTNTADWTMSKRIPPQNIEMDMHYLCTVAAGGHKKVVKPLRVGIRHGHRVLVNRQLCIANAFEELIHERVPRFHRAVRGFYDRYGYPVAKHIHSASVADLVYILMKPLEWLFLTVLYLFDPAPENRIAVQYPHSTPPEA